MGNCPHRPLRPDTHPIYLLRTAGNSGRQTLPATLNPSAGKWRHLPPECTRVHEKWCDYKPGEAGDLNRNESHAPLSSNGISPRYGQHFNAVIPGAVSLALRVPLDSDNA